jgi:hypothetical protein
MVYGLGRRGAQALRDHSVHADASDWTERNKRAGAKFIEHTLAIANFMVGLNAAPVHSLPPDCKRPRDQASNLGRRQSAEVT